MHKSRPRASSPAGGGDVADRRRRRGRELAAVLTSIMSGWLVLALTISAALALPSGATLSLPGLTPLTATRPVQGFAELTERFIRASLGLPQRPPGELAASPAGGDGSAALRLAAPTVADSASPAVPPSDPTQHVPTVEHSFENDDFDRAYVVKQLPFTGRTNTAGASRERGEPTDCAVTGGTAWYRYKPSDDHGLFAHTFGSRYPLALAAYEGAQLDALRRVGCSQAPTGNAQVGFLVRAERTYYFQISGIASGGPLVFGLERLGRTARASVPTPGAVDDWTCASAAKPRVCASVESQDDRAPAVSGNGRYIVFQSRARSYDRDRRGPASCPQWGFCSQIYLHDRATGVTEMISRSSDGVPGSSGSYHPAVSHDGRYVAFSSYASNLVPDDTNRMLDVFVHDRLTGTTSRESVASDGTQASMDVASPSAFSGSMFPSISANGRYLTFGSNAGNLTSGRSCDVIAEGAGCMQIYLRDRRLETTRLVSVASDGKTAAVDAAHSAISADGRRVTFVSFGDRLTPGVQRVCKAQGGDCAHVYLRDLVTGRTTLVDRSEAGRPGDGGVDPWTLAVNHDGTIVAFWSEATNLVADDTNATGDAFVVDMRRRHVERVSVSSSGEQAAAAPTADGTNAPTADVWATIGLSATGRYVAFASIAPNLVPNDTNAESDIFVRDRRHDTTVRVSVSPAAEQADSFSIQPRMSADGSVVTFTSNASNLEASRKVQGLDVYYHDRELSR